MTISAEQTTSNARPFGKRWCPPVIGSCALVVALPLFIDSPPLSAAIMVFVVVGALTMILVGVRRHRPTQPLPWYLLSASAVLFATGTALRDGGGDTVYHFDDLFTLAGYFSIGVAATLWLRPRRGHNDYDLLLDSTLIGLGALLACWTFLISPILRTAAPTTNTLIAAMYPVLDALLLTLVAHSVATANRSETSLRLLHVAMFAVFIGNLGVSLESIRSAESGRQMFDHQYVLTPLLAAYAIVGLAALHPTMASLGGPRRIHPHRSRQRASFIAVTLIVAALVPVVGSTLELLDRIVVFSLSALLLIGVLIRSERAIARSTRSERRAQYHADHDMLTGLRNRSALLRTLNRDRTYWLDQPLSLLFIDLDGFKMVNDSYGHAVGDELIANAGGRIRRVTRRDDVVARYGGDEFVVLAPLGRPEAVALAQRLLGAFVRPFALSAGEVPITASVGIACAPAPGTDPDSAIYDLIRDADAAMYHAKEHSLGYTFHVAESVAPPDSPRSAPATRRLDQRDESPANAVATTSRRGHSRNTTTRANVLLGDMP